MKFNPFSLVLGMAKSSNPLIAIGLGMAEMALTRAGVTANAKAEALAFTKEQQKSMQKDAMDTHPTMVDASVVAVKSAWFSKVNWVSFAGPMCSVFAAFGLNLTENQLVALVISVQAVQSILTWIIRTWFTRSVTPGSVAPPNQKV